MSQKMLVLKNEETVVSPASHPSQVAPEGLASASLFARVRRRRALLWGIVSTVLSAIGLIGLAMFEQYNAMLSELRADLKHFNETSGEYVRKEKVQRFRDEMRTFMQEMTAGKLAREQLERELQASQQSRLEMAKQMQQLRERLAYLEGVRASTPGARTAAPEPADSNTSTGPGASGSR